MYCLYGNSSWYIDCCPLYGKCPLLGVSVIGGSTVLGEHTGMKLSCIKPTSKVSGLSIKPFSSTGCID